MAGDGVVGGALGGDGWWQVGMACGKWGWVVAGGDGLWQVMGWKVMRWKVMGCGKWGWLVASGDGLWQVVMGCGR